MACLLLTASPLFAQTKTVTGTVTDAQNEPLIGVSVLIQGTASGTVTDLDGNYSISVMPENVLEFSYVGNTAQRFKSVSPLRVICSQSCLSAGNTASRK